MVDPATPGYAANVSNNGYTYAVNAADYNTTVTLDVYGPIKDASPSQTADGLTKLAGNFYLSNQTLVGAVGFRIGARKSTPWLPIPPAATLRAIPVGAAWAAWRRRDLADQFQRQRLGGPLRKTMSIKPGACSSVPQAERRAAASGAMVRIISRPTLCQLQATLGRAFDDRAIAFNAANGQPVEGTPYQWSEAWISQNTYGTASTVAAGGSGNLLSLFPLDFVIRLATIPPRPTSRRSS